MTEAWASLEQSRADASAFVEELRTLVVERWSEVVEPGSRVALVDFPNHPNAGDTAIWLGSLAILRTLGCDVAYRASFSSYSASLLRRRLGRSGKILLHGGGNFGEVWPTYQKFRERVIAEHTERRIVQLPQSMNFRSADAIRATAAVLSVHPDLVLLARDGPTEALAREHFATARVLASPDAAFGLGVLQPGPPDLDRLLFLRTDKERATETPGALPPRSAVLDWPRPTEDLIRLRQLSRGLGFPLKRLGPAVEALEAPLERLFTHLAHRRMQDGLDVLSRGRVVVTDRVHGHILSLLLGRPHVLMDNNYGKNRRFYDAWTAASPITAWADDLPQALALADRMQP